jgi:hypothetical protein
MAAKAKTEKKPEPKEFRLLTPSGKAIQGTLEVIQGCAKVGTVSGRDPTTGLLEFDYGSETDLFWDGQETVQQDGERVWIDVDGDEWRESQLLLVPVEDEGE